MNRLAYILLLAVLLGPQVDTLDAPRDGVCQETGDCCPPGGPCDVNCVACACCTSTLTHFSPMVAFDPISVASGAATPAAGSIALPVLSTDILHVPKSV